MRIEYYRTIGTVNYFSGTCKAVRVRDVCFSKRMVVKNGICYLYGYEDLIMCIDINDLISVG